MTDFLQTHKLPSFRGQQLKNGWNQMKKIVIIGAGPAGITAALELSKNKEYQILVLEESQDFGGISKTVNYKGNRMDMGGHRFFSKDRRVNEWWEDILPPESDDNKASDHDEVFMKRPRVSRILYKGKFYDYPVSLSMKTIRNMGFFTTIKVGFGYIFSMIHKKPEVNLENFYINRFGKPLYKMFFEDYTENLWGRHPREIDASWGAQRVKGLSISALLKDVFSKKFHKKNRVVETSLIEEFKYPKYGPGQMWECAAKKAIDNGVIFKKNAEVTGVNENTMEVEYLQNGNTYTEKADYIISSMPVKDLINAMKNVPSDIKEIAKNLPYRDYMTLGVKVDRLNLKNKKGDNNLIPDCWIYVQDTSVKMGRLQIYNNWSPYMVADNENTAWLGLEYFVNENDEFWNMSEKQFSEFCVDEMIKIGLIVRKEDVLDTHMEKVKKAYPAYFDSYSQFDKVKNYIDMYDNIICVGRNGQHRYNNMDHSMITAFKAVEYIEYGKNNHDEIWNVNTEKTYHEERK